MLTKQIEAWWNWSEAEALRKISISSFTNEGWWNWSKADPPRKIPIFGFTDEGWCSNKKSQFLALLMKAGETDQWLMLKKIPIFCFTHEGRWNLIGFHDGIETNTYPKLSLASGRCRRIIFCLKCSGEVPAFASRSLQNKFRQRAKSSVEGSSFAEDGDEQCSKLKCIQ
jgi:hypothetical protein